MIDTAKKLRKLWDYGEVRTAIAAVCAHTVCISIGICQGYSAILIPQLMASPDISIDAEQASWIASLGAISNPIGSILSGLLAEILGRRRSMQISSVPFAIGWAILGTGRDISWLYAGRFITGIAAGMSTASYTYVAEVSTPENRGILQSLGPINGSLGVFLTYTLGYVLNWNVTALGAIVFAAVTFVGIHFVPESPSWLTRKGRTCEAMDALVWLRRSVGAAEREFEDLKSSSSSSSSSRDDGERTKIGAYLKVETLKPFAILLVLFLCQQLSGIYTILYYSVNLFKDFNVQIDEYVASMVVGFIRFFVAIFAAFLVSRFPRKSLCTISALGMSASMFAAAGYVKFNEHRPNAAPYAMSFVPLISILCNVFFSMIGMLPIPWILTAELFSLEVRGIMSGLVVCLAQVAIFVSIKVHPAVVTALGFSGALFIFAGASLFTIFFVRLFLPETKDMSLNDIENYFKQGGGGGGGGGGGKDNFGFGTSSEELGKYRRRSKSENVI